MSFGYRDADWVDPDPEQERPRRGCVDECADGMLAPCRKLCACFVDDTWKSNEDDCFTSCDRYVEDC